MKKFLLLCVSLVFLAGCGQIEENKRLKEENRLLKEKDSIENVKRLEEEARRVEEQKRMIQVKNSEINNPGSYISVNAQIGVSESHLFLDDEYMLKGDISSNAKYHYYNNVTIKISYYSKHDVLLKSENIVYKNKTNSERTAFRSQVCPPNGYNHFTIKVISANAIEK